MIPQPRLGINNEGLTCWMNALINVLYRVPGFLKALLEGDHTTPNSLVSVCGAPPHIIQQTTQALRQFVEMRSKHEKGEQERGRHKKPVTANTFIQALRTVSEEVPAARIFEFQSRPQDATEALATFCSVLDARLWQGVLLTHVSMTTCGVCPYQGEPRTISEPFIVVKIASRQSVQSALNAHFMLESIPEYRCENPTCPRRLSGKQCDIAAHKQASVVEVREGLIITLWPQQSNTQKHINNSSFESLASNTRVKIDSTILLPVQEQR